MSNASLPSDPTLRHGLLAFITRRPVAVTMLVLAVMVFGLISMQRLPLTLMPDISYPSITLRTSWEGAAPEEVEQFVTRPIEQAMGVVSGKVSISSLSRAGQSDVVVEFGWNSDMDLAIQDLREKLETVRLPDDTERPLILRYDPALDPVLRVGLSRRDGAGDESSLRALRLLAEERVKRELEKLPGVAAVKIKGGLEEEIRVELDEAGLSQRGLDIQDITRQLAAENVNLAGGNLKEGRSEYVVRVLSEFGSLEDIARTRLRTPGGAFITLGDIAVIRRTGRDAETLTRVNGRPAVEIEIHKEADANVVKVASRLRQRLFGPGGGALLGAEPAGADSAGLAAARADSLKQAQTREKQKGRGPGAAFGHQGPETLAAQLGNQGVSTSLLADQSTFIEGSLRELRDSALQGGLLAVLVLFLYLRSAGPTLIVSLIIPLSIIATFCAMQLSSLSLNVMSLGGLALGVGNLVDNAIVVLESIHRCREQGDDRLQAAIRGTGEVGMAVTASTLTTVAVFFPMVFVEGVAGQVFGDLALVVVYSQIISLLLALALIPMLTALGAGGDAAPAGVVPRAEREPLRLRAALLGRLVPWDDLRRDGACLGKWRRAARPDRFTRLARTGRLAAWLAGWLLLALRLPLTLALDLLRRVLVLLLWVVARLAALFFRGASAAIRRLGGWLGGRSAGLPSLRGAYPRALTRVLDRPGLTLAALGLAALLATSLLPGLGRELMPVMHQGELYVDAELPVGTPLERTAERLAPLEAFLRAQPEVAGVALVAGADTQGGIDTEGGQHQARLTVRLKSGGNPRRAEEEVLARLRPFLAGLPEVKSRISHPVLFSYRTPIEVQITGHDLDELRASARRVGAALESLPGLSDVHSTSGGGNPEIHVRFRRDELARLGLDLQGVGRLLRNKVLGGVETEFRDVEQRVDVRVRLRPEDLLGLEDIRGLVVNPGQPVPVPLSAVADVAMSEGPSEIRRVEQERTALVRANLKGLDLGSALEGINARLEELDWPAGQGWAVTGQSAEMQRSLGSLYMALALAVFLVYVVMASQFESLLHPLVILAAVPLAFLGVVPVLALLHVPVSVLVFLGSIILVGIVVNNAILLVDTINLFRGEGMARREAIVQAGAQRLRPILMTMLTTVLGLVPMVLGLGDGAELRQPLALTVMVGLSTSTLLTLFVIPVLYERAEGLLDRLRPGRPGGGSAA